MDPEAKIAVELDAITQRMEELRLRQKALLKKQKFERQVQSVNAHFQGKSKLAILQEMCLNLHGEEPDTITACKQLLQDTYINIFDYVNGDYDRACDNKRELLKRCRQVGFFPKKRAKNQDLRALLKTFFY